MIRDSILYLIEDMIPGKDSIERFGCHRNDTVAKEEEKSDGMQDLRTDFLMKEEDRHKILEIFLKDQGTWEKTFQGF